mgnify:CR=1 FL=1
MKRFVWKRFTPALQRAGCMNSSWPRWNHSSPTSGVHCHTRHVLAVHSPHTSESAHISVLVYGVRFLFDERTHFGPIFRRVSERSAEL